MTRARRTEAAEKTSEGICAFCQSRAVQRVKLDQILVFAETSLMMSSLDSFERKIDQLLAITQSLRDENDMLRLRVASLEAEKSALNNKIIVTCERLAALRDQLPEMPEP